MVRFPTLVTLPTLLMLDAVMERVFENEPTTLPPPVKKTDGQFEMEFEDIFKVPLTVTVGEVRVMDAPDPDEVRETDAPVPDAVRDALVLRRSEDVLEAAIREMPL
jgi:hypothetical protein